MPRTGNYTTRDTRLSRAQGAGTQKRTAGSATHRTADADGQWRIIEGRSGLTEFFDRKGEVIVGGVIVFLYMVFLMGGV